MAFLTPAFCFRGFIVFAAVCFLGGGVALPTIALGAAPAAAQPPITVIPSNANSLRHAAEYRACEQRLAAIAGQPCDLIFIGDSITQAWESVGRATWQQYYGARHALNFGISGDRTENVLWRFDHFAIQSLRPKVAIILIGTNDVQSSPAEIAQGIQAILARTRQCFPGVKIILVSILPNAREKSKMAAVNPLIRSYADDSHIFYLDLVAQFTPMGDNWKGLGPDRLHPSASGYQIWAATMEKLLNSLL